MTNQQAPEALPDPSTDQLRAIARTARNSSGSASDDCGPLAYVLHGWRSAVIAFRAQQAALVEAQQPAPSAAAVVNPDPHAELRKTWQPGQRWQARSFRNGQWGPWTDAVASEPFWFPHQDYRRHPDDLAPQPSPTPQADSQPAPDQRQQLDAYYSLLDAMGWESKRQHISPETWAADLLRDATAYRAARAPADSVTAPAATPAAASIAWNALRDLTDPLGDAGVKIMGHVRVYAQRQYEAGLAARPMADSVTAPAGGVEVDWERETDDPIAEMDAIFEVYKRSMGKPAPDAEMGRIVEKTRLMLMSWWGWHREDIRAALVANRETPPAQAADSVLEDAAREVLMEHSGCGSGTQVEMLTVKLNPGDKVVMLKGRITQAIDAARKQGGVDGW